MDLLKKFESLKPMHVFKIAAVAVAGLVLVVFILQMLGSTFRPLVGQIEESWSGRPTMGYGGGVAYDMAVSSEGAYYADGKMMGITPPSMPQLSTRNVADSYPAPQPASPMGNTAEQYEVTQYNASIETRHLDKTCGTISSWKAREDVIFESANTYDRGCSFSFKVANQSVEEVLAALKALNPKDLSENTYTIKRQVDDYTNEVEVLQKKRDSIDETLESAMRAYTEITTLATRTQNADALAQIIDSKIRIIERLTQERININEQLDRLARAKAEQLDRLDYTYFYVDVYKNTFIDGEQLKDSWKAAITDFVGNLNKVVQDITINLVYLVFLIIQWALYALIAIFVAKYGWKLAIYIWHR